MVKNTFYCQQMRCNFVLHIKQTLPQKRFCSLRWLGETPALRNDSCLSGKRKNIKHDVLFLLSVCLGLFPKTCEEIAPVRCALTDTPPFKTNTASLYRSPWHWTIKGVVTRLDDVFCSPLKVRYPNRAANRYMTNMPRNETFATFCIFLLERLQIERQRKSWFV